MSRTAAPNSGVEFLSPNTISCIIVLKEYSLRHSNELDPSNPFANFLINKIMRLNEEEQAQSSSQFFKKMIKESQNFEISERYRQQVERIASLHDLFIYLQTTLKELRQNRCGRVDQGNVIDLFLRRSLLNFGRCGFSEMVTLYQNFADYKNDQYKAKRQGSTNSFIADKKLEDLQLKILNFNSCYSYEDITKQLDELEMCKSNEKVAYLRGHNEARNDHPLAALDSMHKYFDKQLELLFVSEKQSDQQVSYNQSQVNHCILNLAYLNLEMGLVDECLRSLGEAMRISQNNQDEESINHCIIYLYEMSALLCHPQDAIALTKHAISHALTQLQTSPLLLLHSSLALAQFSQHFGITNCNSSITPQVSTFNNNNSFSANQMNYQWLENVHLSSRRIISNYETSMLSTRKQSKISLLSLPRTVEFLVKSVLCDGASQPALVDLLLNSIYDSSPSLLAAGKCLPILFELAFNQLNYDLDKAIGLFMKLSELTHQHHKTPFRAMFLLSNAQACIHRGETASARNLMDILTHELCFGIGVVVDPQIRAKIQQCNIEILLKDRKYVEARIAILAHIADTEHSGLHTATLTQAYILLLILYYHTRDFLNALPLVQKIVNQSKHHGLKELAAVAKLYKALILIQQGYINATLKILKKLEERQLANFSSKTQAQFYYVKAILMMKIAAVSWKKNELNGVDIQEETRKHALVCLNKSLELYLNLNYLTEAKDIYYLQARLYDEMGIIAHRESAAFYFITAEEAGCLNSVNSLIASYQINDLSLYKIQLALSANFKKTFKIVLLPPNPKTL